MVEPEGVDLILGSASPRRASLLDRAGYTYRIQTVAIDEPAVAAAFDEGDITAATAAIARAKFDALSTAGGRSVLTADTLVSHAGTTMGKPTSNTEVAAMLERVSGGRIVVVTSVCLGTAGVGSPRGPAIASVATSVGLREISQAVVRSYVATGVGLDKAAGLALQSAAAPFITEVAGCWSNVLGLPLCAVAALRDGHADHASIAARCPGHTCGGG